MKILENLVEKNLIEINDKLSNDSLEEMERIIILEDDDGFIQIFIKTEDNRDLQNLNEFVEPYQKILYKYFEWDKKYG